MESPPSSSTWSEAFILSDDSGLLLTSGSISSGSMSGDSRSGHCRLTTELQDSDCEDKSFSQTDSLDGMSDIMGGENFNTLKKGPHWLDLGDCKNATPIEPPPEFQDKPNLILVNAFADILSFKIIRESLIVYYSTIKSVNKLPLTASSVSRPFNNLLARAYWKSDFIPFGSPPGSRSSLGSSRLSSSHNSLSVPAAHKVDDSSFITQAVSHDTLVSSHISDLYNVPFDSDMYAVPIDVVKPPVKSRRLQHKKRRRNTSSCCHEFDRNVKYARQVSGNRKVFDMKNGLYSETDTGSEQSVSKRHSVAGTSASYNGEPVHMTLQQVRQYLQTLYSSSSDSSEPKYIYEENSKPKSSLIVSSNNKYAMGSHDATPNSKNGKCNSNGQLKYKKNTFLINIKNKKVKDSYDAVNKDEVCSIKYEKPKKAPTRMLSFKQTLCNIFRFRRVMSPEHVKDGKKKTEDYESYKENNMIYKQVQSSVVNRALPPLPPPRKHTPEPTLDFATSIHKVKDYGWYWGPLSSEAAEKILSNEPDGSFIVRDSSDDHYIFSLTFKLNNSVRHVRIEHDQGNFSFGSCTKFKSQTIVEFIENAVEHSRSGRYLFFLHRRPTIGPVRVQLLHPLSRFKQIQSLQHICRFVILKVVRKDLIPSLPLPRRMIDYLSTPHYYAEHVSHFVEESDENKSNNNSEQGELNNTFAPTIITRDDYYEDDNVRFFSRLIHDLRGGS